MNVFSEELYDYDEADRLVHVCGRGGTTSCVQERVFDYDNRGFLLSEQHPEIGPGGNGTSTYSYDASGNVLSKDIVGSNDFSPPFTPSRDCGSIFRPSGNDNPRAKEESHDSEMDFATATVGGLGPERLRK